MKHTFETAAHATAANIDTVLDTAYPSVHGWVREHTRGGVLHSGSVGYLRTTHALEALVVCWVDIDGADLTCTYEGWVAERLPGDSRHYQIEDGFMRRKSEIVAVWRDLVDIVRRSEVSEAAQTEFLSLPLVARRNQLVRTPPSRFMP